MSLGQIPASVKEAVHIKMEAPLFFFVPQKLLESSTEIAPSRGSFMKKERLGKGFTFLLHTSVGASVLDAQRCGSSRSKRSTHVFKCKAPGLFRFQALSFGGNLPLDVQEYGSSHVKRQEVRELSHETTKFVGALILIARKKG